MRSCSVTQLHLPGMTVRLEMQLHRVRASSTCRCTHARRRLVITSSSLLGHGPSVAAVAASIVLVVSAPPCFAIAPAVVTAATAQSSTLSAATSLVAVAAPSIEAALSDRSLPLAPLPIPTTFPPLPQLHLPKYIQSSLPNGLRIFLLEDHEVPLVRGTLLMSGGQHASPADKVGLASVSANIQRSGGSVAHPGAKLNDKLEDLAAAIEFSAGAQTINADFVSMADDVEQVLGLFAEVVRTPALPASKLSLQKAQLRNVLEHRYDNPGSVSRRELQRLLYGRNSIYARSPNLAMLESITLKDVQQYIADWERPDSAVLGVVGDFDPAVMLKVVEGVLGGWQPGPGQLPQPRPLPQDPPLEPRGAGHVYLVDRKGLVQASVSVGEPGISLSDPDTYALDILGSMFNSFGGRLFDRVRSREGLAYSVSGGWDTPPAHRGAFIGGGETSTPGQFLLELRKVLQQATESLPPPASLATARSESLNTFVFNFASSASQLQRVLVYDLLGLPQDFLFQYAQRMESVTGGDVLAAARRHLHPQQQTVVIAADAARVLPELRRAGFEPTPLELDPL